MAADAIFYDAVTIVDIGAGTVIDGEWRPGKWTERTIFGSFQSGGALAVRKNMDSDAGQGTHELWTRTKLEFYDPESPRQMLVKAQGVYWRIIDRKDWGPISQGLYVYTCERYEPPAKDEPQVEEPDEAPEELPEQDAEAGDGAGSSADAAESL